MSPDATAMIRTCAERQLPPPQRVIRWDGTHVTEQGDASFRIEVWTRAALAEAILRLSGIADAVPEEVSAFEAFLPLGSFAFATPDIARWRELYRAQKGLRT